jgi:hypothetical protein
MRFPTAALVAVLAVTRVLITPTLAATPAEDGFVPLFNRRDFTGWTNINCAPETWSMRDGVVHCTGVPTGALRTTRHYENFILELEWRHLASGGNSGVFIWGSPINAPGVPFLRGIEVQVLDHGYATRYEQRTGKKPTSFTVHGDVFPIHGATMAPIGRSNGRRSFPSEERSKPSPEWNHYRIVANNGSIRLHVNGREVSGGDNCNYRKGYLALESEGAPVEFRNVRIKELPSSNPAADVTAPVDPGWRALFNGVDLRGWTTSPATDAVWQVSDEKLVRRPRAEGATGDHGHLWTVDAFGDAEFVVDFQPAAKNQNPDTAPQTATVLLRSGSTPVALSGAQPGKFSRFVITVRGREVVITRDGETSTTLQLPANAPVRGQLGLASSSAAGVFMNLHVRAL